MLQHLQAFVSAGSQQKAMSFSELLFRSTVVSLLFVVVMLAVTGVGYLAYQVLT